MNTRMKAVNKPVPKFSVLMSVYHSDVPEQLDAAISSVVNQTWPPDEIVLVEDGPITESLASVVNKWTDKFPELFRIVALPTNVGLGAALKAGMERCSHEIIARMDADDISMPNRFEEQFSFLNDHPEIDVVGSWVKVFDGDPNKILFETHKPTTHEEISELAKFRSPVMHGGCMYRRSGVWSAGGYSGDYLGMEDYHLWVRMLLNGSRMANIPKFLYKNRRNTMLGKRRRGLYRVRVQISLQREFLRIGFISRSRFAYNIILRTIVSILPYGLIQYTRFKFGLDKKAE